ncbi:MAG: gas vesicle protein [archaeon]|nr:gas vesicle protein [archaeon]MCP8313025.1 gas vesicle protein [archaeon]MCP8317445.1 gas vesicle protein [archaeon]
MESVLQPIREKHATLVDLLDRVLDKGLVINADIIISVAGIPLLGVNLRAALASMETMLRYGLLKDWDERMRSYARKEAEKKEPKEALIEAISKNKMRKQAMLACKPIR